MARAISACVTLAGRRGIALFPFSREFPPFELGLDFVRVAAVGRPGRAEPSGIKTEKVADEMGIIFLSCVRLDWSANRMGDSGLGQFEITVNARHRPILLSTAKALRELLQIDCLISAVLVFKARPTARRH
jgi:hypothetical protein